MIIKDVVDGNVLFWNTKSMKHKLSGWIILVLLVFIFLIAGGIYLVLGNQIISIPNNSNTSQVACTMDAKLCPDGSYVGRSGPNCEFEKCAGEENASLKTYINSQNGFSVEYSSNWMLREFPDTNTGAAFRPSDKPNDYQYEYITVQAMDKPANAINIPFAEYVKVAGTQEIQNYQSLNSIEEITTKSGIVGYKTTWNVLPLGGGNSTVSGPITYFPDRNSNAKTIQVSLSDNAYMNEYNIIINTFEYTK